ncbi:NAD(P)-dependent dehydrogenase (short-subunit alcohol dehydrogenase family) [Arthrobacter sp. OAP107]
MTAGFVSRNAPITGAGRGTGAAIVPSSPKVGASVIILARTADRLDEIGNPIRACAPRVEVRVMTADLTDDTEHTIAVGDMLSGGPADVLINNGPPVRGTIWKRPSMRSTSPKTLTSYFGTRFPTPSPTADRMRGRATAAIGAWVENCSRMRCEQVGGTE